MSFSCSLNKFSSDTLRTDGGSKDVMQTAWVRFNIDLLHGKFFKYLKASKNQKRSYTCTVHSDTIYPLFKKLVILNSHRSVYLIYKVYYILYLYIIYI